jgi:hemolysin III
MLTQRTQTLTEEVANSVSHVLGVLGAVASLPLLAAVANRLDRTRMAGMIVFAATMLLVFAASSLYHALPAGRAKNIARRMDHAAIFLFIGGSYTPFALAAPDVGRPTVLALIWSVALLGTALKLAGRLRERRVSTGRYVAYSGLVLLACQPMLASMARDGLALLFAGGLAYSAGCVFYVFDHRLRYGHLVWHLLVLVGSGCHLAAVVEALS